MWNCNFCQTANPLLLDLGFEQIEEYIEGKVGDNGIYFIIDLCLPDNELASIKEIILSTIEKLPENIFVGLMAFNRNVFLCDFEDPFLKFGCLGGHEGTIVIK